MTQPTNPMQRRRFLQLSAAAITGGALLPTFHASAAPKKGKIIYRTLGKTGIKLPLISMGAMRGDNKALIDAGLKMGVVHFDTANSYQNGKNEEMLADVFAKRKRKEFVVATKVVPDDMDRKTGQLGEGATAEKFLKKFDESLSRLKLDYVDILYVHALSSREAVLHPEMIKAVTQAKQSGKAKFIGVSTHQNEPTVLRAMVEAGIYDVALVAINFKQDHRQEVLAAITEANQAGIGIVAMKTMAGGFLDKEKSKPINTKAALKWVMQNQSICTAIPGFTTYAQLEESFSVMNDLSLSPQEQTDLEQALAFEGLFCNQCGQCLGQCKKGLPVNDIMRAYMYTYGYREAAKGKELLAKAQVEPNPCSNCNNCTVQCIKHFDVASRIEDVTRLMNVPNDFIA